MPRKKPETGENSPHSMAPPKKTGRASKSTTEARKKSAAKGKRSPKAKAAPAVTVEVDDGEGGEPKQGRPPKYRPEFVDRARELCSQGATDYELGLEFGVCTTTIWRWQTRYPDFCNALKVQKGEFDDRVVRALAQRAVGYTFRATKIFMPANATQPVYAEYDEHIPPDPNAAFRWLMNRQGWRDKTQTDHGITNEFAEFLSQIDGNGASLI